eukprot:IDg1115t1
MYTKDRTLCTPLYCLSFQAASICVISWERVALRAKHRSKQVNGHRYGEHAEGVPPVKAGVRSAELQLAKCRVSNLWEVCVIKLYDTGPNCWHLDYMVPEPEISAMFLS